MKLTGKGATPLTLPAWEHLPGGSLVLTLSILFKAHFFSELAQLSQRQKPIVCYYVLMLLFIPF